MELFSSPKSAGGYESQIAARGSEDSALWLGIAGIIGIGAGLLGLLVAQVVTGTGYSITFFMPLMFCATMAILGRDKIGKDGRLFWWQLIGFPTMIAVTIGTAMLVRSLSPGNGGNSGMLLVLASVGPFLISRMLEGENRRQMEAISLWISVALLTVFAGVAVNVFWSHWPLPSKSLLLAIGEAIAWGGGLFLMTLGLWLARLFAGKREIARPAAWGEGQA